MTNTNDKRDCCEREFDFALIVDGVEELTDDIAEAIYTAGCDDATVSIQHGLLYIEFSRMANTLQEAIISGIRDVLDAEIGAIVLRVDECSLVTQAEIARRIDRTRQMVSQYMSGQRGPGRFPPPACNLTEGKPLWQWCAVSYWLYTNNLINEEDYRHAAVIEAINNVLESLQMPPEVVDSVRGGLQFLHD